MFEKEAYPQDFSSIDMTNYTSEKPERNCQLPCNSIALFIVVGFFFIFIGIAELISNYQANSVQITLTRQGNMFTNNQQTYVSFHQDENVGIYLQIQNLTQFTYKQTQKYQEIEHYIQSSSECQNYRLNKELRKTTAIDGTALNPNDVAVPCGLYEGMFPMGSISVLSAEGSNISVDATDLTYFEYEMSNGEESRQWVDLESQAFQSWIQQNAEIGTTKLIGHLPASFSGLVQVTITMLNDLPKELNQVSVTLASNKAFANKNISFCILNFFQSCCLFLFSFVIFFYNKLIDREIDQSSIPSHELQLKSQLEPQSVKGQLSE